MVTRPGTLEQQIQATVRAAIQAVAHQMLLVTRVVQDTQRLFIGVNYGTTLRIS
jgi:hypothetical protein